MLLKTQLILLAIQYAAKVKAIDLGQRWGQASLLIPDPPTLLLSGGKLLSTGHTYTSSLNSPDLIALPLTNNFNLSSPPYTLLSSDGPAYSFHTLSLISSISDSPRILSFGGNGGTSTALPAGTDSSWIWTSVHSDSGLKGNWEQESTTWANQPSRRIYHSVVSSSDGTVYVTGGQRDDGSNTLFSEVYAFNPASSTFSTLPALPQKIAHHESFLISNGTLVVLGGMVTSLDTGNPQLSPLTSLWAFDTTSSASSWRNVAIGGSIPRGRRGAASVLVDGDRIWINGGGSLNLEEAIGNTWMLDLKFLVWSEMVNTLNSPLPRFDHTATLLSNGQILVTGGYGSNGAVDGGSYLFDTTSSAWTTEYTAPRNSPSGSASNPSSPSQTQQTPPGTASSPINSTPTTKPDGTIITTSANPSSPSPTLADAEQSGGLSTGTIVGISIGALSLLGIVLAVLVMCMRKRRQSARSPSRTYGSREKGGPGLFGDQYAEPSKWSEKGGIVGLGLGLNTFRPFSRLQQMDEYHNINENDRYSPPAKRISRKIGNGIKLIGPRDPTSRYDQIKGPTSPITGLVIRRDMFMDEDSRTFTPIQNDWTVDKHTKKGWRSASSVLGHDRDVSDPFSDSEPPKPAYLAGGPVPTPKASTADLNPFEGEMDIGIKMTKGPGLNEFKDSPSADYDAGPGLYQLPSVYSDPLDLNSLFPPPANSDKSLSKHSRASTYLPSDAEEGQIQHAHLASHLSPSIYSTASPDPDPMDEYKPITRTESFFKRITGAGLTAFKFHTGANASGRLNSIRRGSLDLKDLDIRDPYPGPIGLWPVESRSEHTRTETAESSSEKPSREGQPSAWITSPSKAHMKGPSAGSLHSARSMRDMVIVQREATESSDGVEARIEDGDREYTDNDIRDFGTDIFTSPIEFSDVPSLSLATYRMKKPIPSPTPSPSPSPPRPKAGLAESTSTSAHLPSIVTTSSPSSDFTPTKKSSKREPPSGSPLSGGIIQHRRPVKDMVSSINKRASRDLLRDPGVLNVSPNSQYSASPSGSPALASGQTAEGRNGKLGKQKTSYEVRRRRESLMIANPDEV